MKKRLRRGVSIGLILVLLFSLLTVLSVGTSAATVTKTEKTYEIAVVFDNSGSMYTDNGCKAWCRAKYAMEIFASMLNYENGDVLKIYPMWGVVTDGSTPGSGGSYAPIEIKSGADLDKISNLYTILAEATPYAPVTEAFNDLNQSKANEKWLVVLTDGEFNLENRGDKNYSHSIDLSMRLPALAQGGIKVQYLGFGGASAVPANEAKGFYSKKSTDTSLKDDLIAICNTIFQRSELKGKLSGNTLTLDMSMKNLIVFAQGADAKIVSLKNAEGVEIEKTLDSGQRKYSRISAGGREGQTAQADTSLAGQVVMFGSCTKGQYTLDCNGADKIQVFYEPDVDVKISLLNSEGQEMNPEAEPLVTGDYQLQYGLIDSKTDEDVTSAPLLGGVSLKAYTKDSDGNVITEDLKNGDIVTLLPNEGVEVHVEGRYLKDYRISTEENGTGLRIGDSQIIPPPLPKLEVSAKVLQSNAWYQTGESDDWKPIRVSLLYDGKPLSDEQMNAVNLDLEFSKELPYICRTVPGESAYDVTIATDENGAYHEPECGGYSMTAKATLTDEYGQQTQGEDRAGFEVQWYSVFWRWFLILLIILIILIILTIITLILHSIKVFPHKVVTEQIQTVGVKGAAANLNCNSGKLSLFKKDGNIRINSVKGNFGITLRVETTANLFRPFYKYQRPSRRGYKIIGINATGISRVRIDGTNYTPQQFNDVNIPCTANTTVEFEKYVHGELKRIRCDIVSR